LELLENTSCCGDECSLFVTKCIVAFERKSNSIEGRNLSNI